MITAGAKRNEKGQIVPRFNPDGNAIFDRIEQLKEAKVYPFRPVVAAEFDVPEKWVSEFYSREKARRARLAEKARREIEQSQAKVRLCPWCEAPLPPVKGNAVFRYCCAGCAVQANVKRVGDCWVWQKSLIKGYGQLVIWGNHGAKRRAHQIAYECFTGDEIPPGMWVLHSCDNRACCNPRHLRVGSALDNVRDAISRRRNCHGERRPASKLTDAIVLSIRRDKVTASGELARRYGVSLTALCCARTGATWRHLPLDPEPEEQAA